MGLPTEILNQIFEPLDESYLNANIIIDPWDAP